MLPEGNGEVCDREYLYLFSNYRYLFWAHITTAGLCRIHLKSVPFISVKGNYYDVAFFRRCILLGASVLKCISGENI